MGCIAKNGDTLQENVRDMDYEEDVKEFIKLLKEEANKVMPTCFEIMLNKYVDKLAGGDLI